MRRVAGGISVGWHLLVAAMLVWLMYQQYMAPEHPPRKGQEDVVQVEFVGQGTPAETGGGADSVPAPAPQENTSESMPAATQLASEQAASVPPQTQPDPAEVAPVDAQAAAPAPESDPEPVTTPAPPAATQTVQVSEVVPDTNTDYVLPPPVPTLQLPQVRVPDRDISVPEVSFVELPGQRATSIPSMVPRPVPDVAIEHIVRDVVVREIAAPLPVAPTTTVVRPVIAVPDQTLSAQPVTAREIPAPPSSTTAAQPTQAPASATATASSEKSASVSRASSATAASDARAADATAQNAGPKPDAAPGGLNSPKRADDWGDSTREVAGGQKGDPSGLYNSDGSVRLATPPGSAAPGQPPGTVTDEIVNLDRGGTWLKRAPTDYEPTAFDRYWRPNESLLEEWVRKSIKTVRIPIPGTNKYVVCTTVMLVMGGGCDISDPNLLDVPPTARPAPDVPFKPSLQEGNGSLPNPAE